MAKGKKVTVGYWYSLGWHAVLCQGGADAIEEIRYADRSFWAGNVTSNTTVMIEAPNLLGGEKREGGLIGEIDFLFGGPSQGVNTYLAYNSNLGHAVGLFGMAYLGGWTAWAGTVPPGEENDFIAAAGGRPVPAYRGVVSLVFKSFWYAAMNPYLKDFSVRVRRLPRTLNTVNHDIVLAGTHHANPAHIIYDVLTNRVWGMGFSPEDIDLASFNAAAATLYAESFGMSLAWTEEGTAEDFINLVKAHINAVLYPAPDTGRWTLKLIRDDYDIDAAFQASPSNIIRLRSFQRASPTDLVNEVTIQFHGMTQDKPVKLTVQNLAGIQSTGRVVRKVIDMPGIRAGVIAGRVAQRELATLSTPLAKVELDINTSAWNLRPGDVFAFAWPSLGIERLVMRAIEVEYQDIRSGVVSVVAVEDVFGFPETSFVAAPEPDWLPPTTGLSDIVAYHITELPYYVLVQSNGEDYASYLTDNRNYLGVLAGRANSLWQLYTTYEHIGSADIDIGAGTFSPWVSSSATIPKTVTNTVVTYSAFFDDASILVGHLGVVDAEWVQVAAINRTLRTVTLVRGVLDTVPAAHAADARIWLFGEAIHEDYSTERFASESVSLRLVPETPSEALPVASATLRSYTVAGRQQRPYPPGNFAINGVSYPASTAMSAGTITVSWQHRDRVQQTVSVVAQNAASIGPEAGTTYNLRTYIGLTLLANYTGLTGTSQTIPVIATMSLLHFDGANASTTFTDEVGNVWTRTNNAQISTAQSVFGGSSALFDGTADYIETAHRDVFSGVGDMTVEFRIRTAVNNAIKCIVKKGTTSAASGWWISLDASGRITFNMADASGVMTCQGGTILAVNTWYRIAVVKSATIVLVFVDGLMVGAMVPPRPMLANTDVLRIGRDGTNAAYDWNGYIDEFRLSTVARYSDTHPDPGAPFSLAADSPPASVRIELESSRGGIVSWQKHDHTVNLT